MHVLFVWCLSKRGRFVVASPVYCLSLDIVFSFSRLFRPGILLKASPFLVESSEERRCQSSSRFVL